MHLNQCPSSPISVDSSFTSNSSVSVSNFWFSPEITFKKPPTNSKKRTQSFKTELVVPTNAHHLKPLTKNKRRKRAKTKEEREERAIERKRKNRESAMRSRQRVLTDIKALKRENELQKLEIARLKAELQEATKFDIHDYCSVFKNEFNTEASCEEVDFDFGYDETASFEKIIFFHQSENLLVKINFLLCLIKFTEIEKFIGLVVQIIYFKPISQSVFLRKQIIVSPLFMI